MDLEKNNINFKKSSNRILTLNGADIKGMGKSSIDLYDNEMIIKSLISQYTLRKSVNDIDFLIYDRGNFFFDDKIHMGIKGEQFEISCKDNELELRNLYERLVRIRGNNMSNTNLLSRNIPQQTFTNTSNMANNQINQVNQKEEQLSSSEEIRNFYNLMKEGIISEEEFEEKKKELLKAK